MVARLSLPPAGPEPEAYYREIAEQGAELAEALIAGGDEDARSFDAVMAAQKDLVEVRHTLRQVVCVKG